VKLRNIGLILAVSLALSGYSAWLLAERPPPAAVGVGESIPAAGIPLVRRAAAEALWRQGTAVFVDARSSTDYPYGHIRAAVSLPEEEFEERFPALRDRLERARAVVVYCKSEDCGRSLWVALRLWNAGLKQVAIYPAGWNEWSSAGLPVTRTAER
jgi:rhodanese-related sulfurtransferase